MTNLPRIPQHINPNDPNICGDSCEVDGIEWNADAKTNGIIVAKTCRAIKVDGSVALCDHCRFNYGRN